MEEETFYVTHYIPDKIPEVGRLRSIEFLTTRDPSGNGKLYMGFDAGREFSRSDLSLSVEHGGVVELPKSAEIETSEGVYVDGDGGVWIANYNKPFRDSKRRKICEPSE